VIEVVDEIVIQIGIETVIGIGIEIVDPKRLKNCNLIFSSKTANSRSRCYLRC